MRSRVIISFRQRLKLEEWCQQKKDRLSDVRVDPIIGWKAINAVGCIISMR